MIKKESEGKGKRHTTGDWMSLVCLGLRWDVIAVYKYLRVINPREANELFKLKENVDPRTNSYELMMNKGRLEIIRFLTTRAVRLQWLPSCYLLVRAGMAKKPTGLRVTPRTLMKGVI